MLGVYLMAGGDPNALVDGRPVLYIALLVTWETTLSRKDEEGDDSESVEEDCEESSDSGEDEDGRGREPCLLTPLIRAGADIYYIVAEYGIDRALTLTHMAFILDLGDVWFNALERCGFDVDEVWTESDRRLAAFKKLHGAQRSGVDVSCVVDQPESSGLRYRGRRASVEHGV